MFRLLFALTAVQCADTTTFRLHMRCVVSLPQQTFCRKIQICQNKCIRFCLKLNNRDHEGVEEFRKINWLPTKERVEQCVCAKSCLPHTHPNYTNLSIMATTREGHTADYNYHTEILVMVTKLFLSQARNYGIIYLLK